MAQLLLELLTEEIPARMQARAAADLQAALERGLGEAGLSGFAAEGFCGPRRLGAVIEDLPPRSPDIKEERKGPRTDAPQKAIEGFLRGAGLDSLEQCEERPDPKGKGAFYVAVIERAGRAAPDILAELIPAICADFPWPKSMRTGHVDEHGAPFHWVRPLQRVLCLYDGAVVPFEVGGVAAGDLTEGHRFHGRGPHRVTDHASYVKALEANGVSVDRDARRAAILEGAQRLCAEKGLELVEDAGLLEEVTGLVEKPVMILGDMDPAFLDLPDEVIRLTMRSHQKYFAVRDPATGALAAHFITAANIEAPDGGEAIAAGNARVLSARLNDARHFVETDMKTPLLARVEDEGGRLAGKTYHAKLGSLRDKAYRVADLARELAPKVGADPELAYRAGLLAKADLVTEMVEEFPELQGQMGAWYYEREKDAEPAVAAAIRDHYKPQGPGDAVPSEPVSAAVALADKLDALVGFFAIDEKPTSSKDPYALRRAALGVIRIVLGAGLRLPLYNLIRAHLLHKPTTLDDYIARRTPTNYGFGDLEKIAHWIELITYSKGDGYGGGPAGKHDHFDEIASKYAKDLLDFFADRLKVHLREEGVRHDVVDAVFALAGEDGAPQDDLVLIVKRAQALQSFLSAPDGEALLAGYKRAANILKAEEKKHPGEAALYEEEPGAAYLAAAPEAAERALIAALDTAVKAASQAVSKEDFEGAMSALAALRAPVDELFEHVTVNAEDADLRLNRLRLLNRLRATLHQVADFSHIEG